MSNPKAAVTARISNPYQSLKVRIEYTASNGELIMSTPIPREEAVERLSRQFTPVRIEVWRGEFRTRWVRNELVSDWVSTIVPGRQGFPRLDSIGDIPAFDWLSGKVA